MATLLDPRVKKMHGFLKTVLKEMLCLNNSSREDVVEETQAVPTTWAGSNPLLSMFDEYMQDAHQCK